MISTARTLPDLGWDEFFQEAFAGLKEEGYEPARVAVEHRKEFLVYAAAGDLNAVMSGRLVHAARADADLPKVGDWVALSRPAGTGPAVIQQVLKRKTSFGRKVWGKPQEEQVLAANVDTIFIVQGLDRGFNPRTLERYLVTVYDSGAIPAVILNKADLGADPDESLAQAQSVAVGVPVLVTSVLTGQGMEALSTLLQPRRTYAFVGPSGAGKSSLINYVLGQEVLATREVRLRDAKGMHTTTRRELLVMPGRGLLIDTPGMREFQLWGGAESLPEVFPDVEALAVDCRFRDCTHTVEKGCAVRLAVEEGRLAEERVKSYLKLRAEIERQQEKQLAPASQMRKRKERLLSRLQWQYNRHRKKP